MKIIHIILYSLLSLTILGGILSILRYRKRIEYRTTQMLSEQITRHYDEVKNIYATMRGWRHDFHNHIQTIKGHIALDQQDLLDTYLDDLDTDLQDVDTLIKSGNITLDAILNSKVSLATSRDIPVDVTAFADEKMTVTDIDLCIILGNLMDNAIDACMLIGDPTERFIRIYIGKLKKQLYISVTNATTAQQRNDSGIYLTTKDRATHGNGLRRIDITVDKYNGYVNRQNEAHVFATEVLLPL